MHALLTHRSVWVRFAALWGLAAAVCLVAWSLGYALLPEGVLRGRIPTQALAGGADSLRTPLAEWARIFGLNLLLATVSIAGVGLILDERGRPLSYVVVMGWAGLYGLLLGTDSFSLPLAGGATAPSLAVLTRSGPYELSAYALLAAALRGTARFRIIGRWWGLRQSMEPVRPKGLTRQEWLAVAAALLLLAWSNAREAYRVVTSAVGQ